MQKFKELPVLRIGLIGSGFIAAFHLQSMLGVRNVSIGGVYSRSVERRTRIADKARSLGLGPAHVFDSIEAMATSGEIDALWLLTPNDARLDVMRAIHQVTKVGAPLRAIACEKPLARTLAEARVMGEGVADIQGITAAVLQAEYNSWIEVEIFSRDYLWKLPAREIGKLCVVKALKCLEEAELRASAS